METLNDFIAQYPASADGLSAPCFPQQSVHVPMKMFSMDKGLPQIWIRLWRLLQRKMMCITNRAKIIYNYALGKPRESL